MSTTNTVLLAASVAALNSAMAAHTLYNEDILNDAEAEKTIEARDSEATAEPESLDHTQKNYYTLNGERIYGNDEQDSGEFKKRASRNKRSFPDLLLSTAIIIVLAIFGYLMWNYGADTLSSSWTINIDENPMDDDPVMNGNAMMVGDPNVYNGPMAEPE